MARRHDRPRAATGHMWSPVFVFSHQGGRWGDLLGMRGLIVNSPRLDQISRALGHGQRPRLSGYNCGPTAAHRCLCLSGAPSVHAVAVHDTDAQPDSSRGETNGNDDSPTSTGSSFSLPRTPAGQKSSTTTMSNIAANDKGLTTKGKGTTESARGHPRARARGQLAPPDHSRRRKACIRPCLPHTAAKDDAPCQPLD